MQTIDIDQQIEQIKAAIFRLQGQLQLLEQLKQSGAIITLPDRPAQTTGEPGRERQE